jgi:hypothetical protein
VFVSYTCWWKILCCTLFDRESSTILMTKQTNLSPSGTGVGTVSADHVARVSRAIFAQLPIKQAAQEVEDDEDDGDEPTVPALDQSGKVKCLAHALQSLDMQAQVYKVLQGKAAPSDWNNRTVKDLYRNALAFKLSNAGPGVARLVEEELCGLNQEEAGLKVRRVYILSLIIYYCFAATAGQRRVVVASCPILSTTTGPLEKAMLSSDFSYPTSL